MLLHINFFMNYMFLFIYWFWIIMIIFFLLKHPLVMGLLLIINTFFLCIFIKMNSFSSWNSYILFLMFLGGVLILFLYNISLISTEMFFYILFKELMFMMLLILFFFYMFNFKESFLMEMMNYFLYKNCLPMMFMFFNNNMIIFLMTYLFLSLICVVNLVYFLKDKGSFLNIKN